MAYQPGERVGDYEVVSVLGAGGMGKVYKVRNTISDRIEAMKVLLPEFQENPELADRFIREIKVQASLSHPNIAQLHTAMRHNNELLMLMEFVEGTSADQMLQQGPIAPAKAAAIAVQVLQALSYAHARGVIHRDIKPANIMLNREGKAKLLDFGIARMKADRRLTQTGVTVGSLYYMSPEQIQGTELDGRSDLYSLGIALYEMVTGRRPFDANSDFSIMAAHLHQDPVPPIQIDPTLPQMLNDIILMATSRNAGARFQSAEAFGVALSNMLREPGVATAMKDSPVAPAQAPPQARTAPAVPRPVPPVAVAPKSNRALYMAIGSLVTVGVIVVGALQLPKYFGTRAEQTTAQPVVTQPVVTQPVATQASEPVPTAEPKQPSRVDEVQPASTPVAQPRPVQTNPAVTKTAAQLPTPTAPQQTQPPQQQQQAPPPQQQQQQQPPPAVAATPAPAVNTAELNAVRERLMKLAARVGAVQSKARSLESSLRGQGLGMRADVSSGLSRMTYYMDETENALRGNDANAAKTALRRADQETETLERILGII